MLLKADKNKIRQLPMCEREHLVKTVKHPLRVVVRNDSANITVKLIDDDTGVTLTAASSPVKYFKTKTDIIAGAKLVGAATANTALANGITEVVFDRGRCQFQGYIKILADTFRERGLKF